jgi:hypothetical protein
MKLYNLPAILSRRNVRLTIEAYTDPYDGRRCLSISLAEHDWPIKTMEWSDDPIEALEEFDTRLDEIKTQIERGYTYLGIVPPGLEWPKSRAGKDE